MPQQSEVTVSGQGIASKADEIRALATGKPYVWGGKTPNGFDCSGFVSYVFKQLFPNQASSFNMDVAGYMSSRAFDDVADGDAQAGDIIIFPAVHGLPNHIGIVYDKDTWIGSQSSTGAAKVKFSNPFWSKRAHKIRRLHVISPASVSMGRVPQALRVA